MTDGHEAAKELERCVKQLGFTGVEILTNVAGKELSDPAFAPFWQKAEQLGALVMIHPNGFTEASRLSRFYFNNVIGNPLETTIALHYLIFDGVLERHPKLKILAVHGGGYLGAYSGRIDHAWGARSDSHGDLPQPPTSYLKRIYVDTVVFTPNQLAELVRVFGPDHVVMGTDYPYDMAEYDPLGHIAASKASMPRPLRRSPAAIASGSWAMSLSGHATLNANINPRSGALFRLRLLGCAAGGGICHRNWRRWRRHLHRRRRRCRRWIGGGGFAKYQT